MSTTKLEKKVDKLIEVVEKQGVQLDEMQKVFNASELAYKFMIGLGKFVIIIGTAGSVVYGIGHGIRLWVAGN